MVMPPDLHAFNHLMLAGDAALAARDLDNAERSFWQAHEIAHEMPFLHVQTHRRLLAIAYRRCRWRSVGAHIFSVAVLSLIGLTIR